MDTFFHVLYLISCAILFCVCFAIKRMLRDLRNTLPEGWRYDFQSGYFVIRGLSLSPEVLEELANRLREGWQPADSDL